MPNGLKTIALSMFGLTVCAAVPAQEVGLTGNEALVDCGSDKVGIFEKSTDGQYAVGWTIRRTNKQAKPVDWSLWRKVEPWKFLDQYDWDPEKQGSPYELVDCVVDLQRKKFLPLPSDWPDWPNKNRGYIAVVWSPQVRNRRFALIQNDSRFYTHNLWLVEVNGAEMHQVDLEPRLRPAVRKILQEKRRVDADRYSCFFPLVENDDFPNGLGAASLSMTEAKVPFLADIPKSTDEDSSVEGFITVRLPEGMVEAVSSSSSVDNPFQSDPELAKADRELNQAYSALQKKLGPAARDALKIEQRKWIQLRDNVASDAGRSSDDSRRGRIESLRDSTEKRTTELKKRLSGQE